MHKIIFIVIGVFIANFITAQDMDSLLSTMTNEPVTYSEATFKATRIINGHSVERMKAGQLDFRIHHRFGQINSGGQEFFGLDQSTVFFGFEYGITDRLMIGIGRSSYEKTYDGFIKYALFRQCKGEKNMPITLTLLAGSDAFTTKWSEKKVKNYNLLRLSYVYQALIARKFNNSLSLQISPTLIHKNLVNEVINPNDIFAVGLGGRYKISKRTSINSEYFYTIQPKFVGVERVPNSFSVGVDIDTGGHVFQICLTNSLPMFERGFITETSGQWKHGDIHLGFNISRVFNLNKHNDNLKY